MDLSANYNNMKDKGGRYITQSLFWETNHGTTEQEINPLFTLKPYDHTVDGVTYPSLKNLYLELADFPEDGEYDFALTVFGPEGWYHWKKICENKILFVYISKWRGELEIKSRASAIRAIVQSAKEPIKGFAAAKYLAEKGWQKRAGRPSKSEVEQTRKLYAEIDAETEEDMQRLIDEGLIPEERH